MPKAEPPAIVWFRDDLRLADQPALAAACARGGPVLCLYVFDEASDGLRPHGAAARWWLHHSLAALDAALAQRSGRLDIVAGRTGELLPALAEAASAAAALWTRRYGGPEIALDTAIKAKLAEAGVEAHSCNGQLLHEPWEVKRGDGGGFMVYSPYWRAARALPQPGDPLPAPRKIAAAPWPHNGPRRVGLADLKLLPTRPDWAAGLRETWTPGEDGAHARLGRFLRGDLKSYAAGRNDPGVEHVSRLSPHLRFGEISPRQIVAAVREAEATAPGAARGADKFVAEIGWREFNYHILYSHPDAARINLQRRFDRMPWRDPPQAELDAWKRGQTGYPLVDAGMRQLWITGYMHNRVRMVTASFLIKHLLIDWRIGEDWFWDTLCDACPANNPLNWQWVAGSGADAAPYFRVFNPVLQGDKFDPTGGYIRRYVPELAALPDAHIHAPWEAPASVLADAGVVLGKTYPWPIVDHADGRKRALAAFESVKGD